MHVIEKQQIWLNPIDDLTYVSYDDSLKIAHGLYKIVENNKHNVEYYWQGEKVEVTGNPDIMDNPYCFASDEVIFEDQVGIYMCYMDQDGDDIGYWDFIDGDFKRM